MNPVIVLCVPALWLASRTWPAALVTAVSIVLILPLGTLLIRLLPSAAQWQRALGLLIPTTALLSAVQWLCAAFDFPLGATVASPLALLLLPALALLYTPHDLRSMLPELIGLFIGTALLSALQGWLTSWPLLTHAAGGFILLGLLLALMRLIQSKPMP